MHWQVIAPNINDEEETPDLRGNAWFRKGLTLAKAGERGLTPEEYSPSTDGRYVFSYQWHPTEDQLLIAAGEKSLDPDQEEISNIYVIIFPD